jgi:meso-butanediol dehydrogenase/(S,S)-butanediol dehydrogenase/diacetyl reductase
VRTAMQRLAGQVAIVTGGAQGIGGAPARRLAEEGASGLIADRDDASAERNLVTIRGAGGTAEVTHVDIANPEDIRAMVELAVQRFGTLNILVNNAFSM